MTCISYFPCRQESFGKTIKIYIDKRRAHKPCNAEIILNTSHNLNDAIL